jgi:hypothetical protein
MLPPEARLCSDVDMIGRYLISLKGFLAIHDYTFCMDDQPCVILHEVCNSKNIVHILVHESIHHVLLWLNAETIEDILLNDDKFDEICHRVEDRGFTTCMTFFSGRCGCASPVYG